MSVRLEINDMISKQKPNSTEKKGAQKSTPINNQANDENVNLKSSSVRRKLDLHNPRDEDENMDKNDIQIEDLPPPPPLESSPGKTVNDNGEKKRRDEDAYVPENDDQSGDDASESVPKETEKLKKNKLRTGPTTRLRATALTTTEKEEVDTMANYLAMQERKRKQATNDVVVSGSGTKTDRVLETDIPFFENEEVELAGSGMFT
ncbi:hypothetical protein POM88_002008 [Heracleum sosnowskyi]|uniref:Uncharacterized protein n=1 Tax=Heracleum sosnowskyi TaxID=360622 RepID=A0AAD8JG30_9APIA|nr:hypothetical protein POM88_002008 [Heracleum sosnowskyi]